MKTYSIEDATVTHPKQGLIKKENVVYYDTNGEEESREIYTINGQVMKPIRSGYNLKTN